MKTVLKISGVLAIVAVVIAGLGYGAYRTMQPRIGTCPTTKDCPVPRLPEKATDITYYLRGAFGPATCYEFAIDEAGYRLWVEDWRERVSDVGPIEEGPFEIWRYNMSTDGMEPARIENGLFSIWTYEDQTRQFGYDKSIGRAYFYSASRCQQTPCIAGGSRSPSRLCYVWVDPAGPVNDASNAIESPASGRARSEPFAIPSQCEGFAYRGFLAGGGVWAFVADALKRTPEGFYKLPAGKGGG